MLKFTPEQQKLVLHSRRQFNDNQDELSTRYGGTFIQGNAAPVHKDVWARWDKEGVEIQRDVLSVFNSLAATNSKPIPIGVLVNHFQTISDSGEVNISLDGRGKAKADAPVVAYHGTPLPIIDSAAIFGWRQMEAERSAGYSSLQPTAIANHQRKIAEKLEDIALNGDTSIVVGGAKMHGLRTAPKRNTDTFTTSIRESDGSAMVGVFKRLIESLMDANFYTEATVYMNYKDWFHLSVTDYSTQYANRKILAAIMEIKGIKEIIPASKVPTDELLAVCKRRDVVEVLNGMPMTTRPKNRLNPEDDYVFLVMAAASLETKFDAEGQCGISHFRKA